MSVSDHIAVFNRGKVLQIGTPYEIYEAPATKFVAKFIGETNYFDCTVLSCKKEGDEYLMEVDVPELKSHVLVTDYDPQPVGAHQAFTIRPEKVRGTLHDPAVHAEPVYNGFQSKLFVKLDHDGPTIRVFKQHTTFLDDGPEIEWKDEVFVNWTAADGYLVKDLDK